MKPTKAVTLQMQVLTWQKDSHGLFDYEATKLNKQYFQIQGPCKIFRNWHSAQTTIFSNDRIKKGQLPQQTFNFLSSIVLRHNGNFQSFTMNPPETPSQDILKKEGNPDQVGPINTNAYIVVRYYKVNHRNSGFPLLPGNIVKLGRVQYRAVEIGGLSKKAHDKKLESFLGEFNGIHNAQDEITGTCKFCLCDDNTPDNFLISPCKCKGSCEGVHVLCLKMWIDSKVKKQVNGVVISYNFTKFQCELCKQPFPRFVTRGPNFNMQMITIERPSKPYLMLEGINQRKQSKEERCLHVISPDEGNSIKMGRGHQCEIRLQDISVSRQHSEIKLSNNDFYIADCTSKFGTLVKLDKSVELSHKVKLQIGRSLYEFQMQP